MDSAQSKPLILVSNDDGIDAKGVHALVDRLIQFGDVVVVCPDSPRSGQSMALTVNSPLRVTRVKDYRDAKMYKTNGTPVDCVKLAMHNVLDRIPTLVVAGINHGSNASINVVYSGTMGAAFEGCAYGLPAIGFSLTDHSPNADFEPCYPFIDAIVKGVLERGLPKGVCLNVNIPNSAVPPTEMRLTKSCKGNWTDEYKEYVDPNGGKFYWLTGKFVNEEPDNPDTDEWCLTHGIVSVVPVMLDRTAPEVRDFSWLNIHF
ncbi:MAG: 5'/3'-nucleotidase SurE [Muribaculaceae bacterium]|nr:5'/3'-nucleotidase SurE [Muribaculaceae bacterium]